MKKKSILITGANRGLGFALTQVFYHSDFLVMPLVREQQYEQELKQVFPDCKPIVANIANDSSAGQITEIVNEIGSLDILINNAGSRSPGYCIKSSTTNGFITDFEVNCVGAFRVIEAVLPYLKRSSAPVILNISSVKGSLAKNAVGEFKEQASSISYRVSKAAQNMLTLCISEQLQQEGIVVTALHPGGLSNKLSETDVANANCVAASQIYALLLNNEIRKTEFLSLNAGPLEW